MEWPILRNHRTSDYCDRVYALLDGSRKFAGGDELTRFKPNPKLVNDVLDALKAGLTLPNACQPPMRIDSDDRPLSFGISQWVGECPHWRTVGANTEAMGTQCFGLRLRPQGQCPVWERFLNRSSPTTRRAKTVSKNNLATG